MKAQIKTGKEINETEINEMPVKEFKIMVIKVHTKVRRTTHEQSENLNKDFRKTY